MDSDVRKRAQASLDPERLQQRAEAAQSARAVLELLKSEADQFTLVHQLDVFWAEVQRFVRENAPQPKRVVKENPIVPMDVKEKLEFDSTLLSFGKYYGQTVSEVLERDPRYLQWYADSTFQEDLRRYLRADSVCEYLRNRRLVEE